MQRVIQNKKHLSQFILDLCGYSLDEANYHRDVYAFHLHIAFRRQAVLQMEKWNSLCQQIKDQGLNLESPSEKQELYSDILAFAQTIVDEVQQAETDPVAVKLIKTGYLSKLDKARKNAEQAIRFLYPAGELAADASIGSLPLEDEYSQMLRAQITHLDTLLSLPFVLEKLCLRLASNQGVNYVPRKNAQVLAALLDTLHNYRDNQQTSLYRTLKLILQISMPDLPADSPLLDTLLQDLLPFLNHCIETDRDLEQHKKALFPESAPHISQARKELLATVGVHIESMQEIVQETLLEPVNQCVDAFGDLQGLSSATELAIQTQDPMERVLQIGTIFTHFDRLASLPAQAMPGVLPPWLEETSNYYQGFRQTAAAFQQIIIDAGQTAYNGLGLFYSRLLSFLPESITRYFSSHDDLQQLLQTIDPDTTMDGRAILIALSFNDLLLHSGVEEALHERLYHAYCSEVCPDKGPLPFVEFEELRLGIKSLNQSPTNKKKIELSGLGSLDLRQLEILNRIKDLKNSENQFTTDIKTPALLSSRLNEFINQLAGLKKSTDESLQVYKTRFLEPALARMLTLSLQELFLPQLELLIDNLKPETPASVRASIHLLPDIYTKIRSGSSLSEKDFDILQSCFSKENIPFGRLRTLNKKLPTKHFQPIKLLLTPHQILVEQIKTLFPPIYNIMREVLQSLDKQRSECTTLLDLVPEGSALYNLCRNKLDYIQGLQAIINELQRKISTESQSTALAISSLIHEGSWDKIRTEASNTSLLSMSKQLVRFAWAVIPADSAKPDDQFLTNFMRYALKDSDIGRLHDNYLTYSAGLNNSFIPEFMTLLGDPLTVGNILPGKEVMLDRLMQGLLDVGQNETALSWAGRILANQTGHLISQIDSKTVIELFPYPFLGRIALEAIRSQRVQQGLVNLISTITTPIHGVLSEQASNLVDVTKNHLYSLLGVNIQKSIEESALHYARYPTQSSNDQRDVFAMYYLQYRAIKENSPDAKSKACVRLLFKELSREAEIELVEAFSRLDQTLQYDQPDALQETENQLQFLLLNLNMQDPDNNTLIRLALINRYLLMALEAAQGHINRANTEFEAIKTLAQVLEKLASVVEENSDLLQQIKPATHLTTQRYFENLRAAVANAQTVFSQFSENNNAQLRDNEEEERLGLTVAAVENNRSRNNWPRQLWRIGGVFYQIASFVSLWASIILPIVFSFGAAAFLQGFFTALGIGAAVGAAATIPGAVVLAALFLSRVLVNTIKQIWTRRREFDAIVNNPDYSGFKKFGLVTLIGLKCLGLATLNAAFTDFIVSRVNNLFFISPAREFQASLQEYPTADLLLQENESLGLLETNLKIFAQSLERQDDILHSPELERAYRELTEQMQIVTVYIEGNNDARRRDNGQLDRLNNCREALTTLQNLMPSLVAIQQLNQALQEKPIEQASSSSSTMITKLPQSDQGDLSLTKEFTHRKIQLATMVNSYLQTTANLTLIKQPESAGYLPMLISGFYEALSYAGRFFNWRWHQIPVSQEATSIATSSSLMTTPQSFTLLPGDSLNTDLIQPESRRSLIVDMATFQKETQEAADSLFDEILDSFVIVEDSLIVDAPSSASTSSIIKQNRLSFFSPAIPVSEGEMPCLRPK